MAEFDAALKIKPESYIYINRSQTRDPGDYAARLADLDMALKLEPLSESVAIERAALLTDQRNYPGAITALTAMLAAHPDDLHALLLRGIAHAKNNDAAPAEKDLVAAHGLAKDAQDFNNLCWEKATHDVSLPSALADCDAAVARAPTSASYLDSRGFVLLRLDRLDEAKKSYDAALAQNPMLAGSLYGRAVVDARRGDRTGSAADAAAALKADPDVKGEFTQYGVTLDAPADKTAAPAKTS